MDVGLDSRQGELADDEFPHVGEVPRGILLDVERLLLALDAQAQGLPAGRRDQEDARREHRRQVQRIGAGSERARRPLRRARRRGSRPVSPGPRRAETFSKSALRNRASRVASGGRKVCSRPYVAMI